MQNIIKLLFFFTLFYTITTEKVKYSLINEAEVWYEYYPDQVLVNITVIQDKLAKETISEFNMALNDEYGDQYIANCKVLPQYEGDKKIPDKYIDTDEAGRKIQKENSDIKGTEGRNFEKYIQAQHAFCYFDPPKVDAILYYVEDTLEVPEDAKFEVEVMDNFFIEFRCGEPWDYSDDDQRRLRLIDENDEDDDWEDDDDLGDDDDGDGDDDDQIKNPTKTNQFLVDLLGFQDFAEESDGTAKGKAYFRGTYDSLIELINYIRVKVQSTNKTRLLRSLADEKVKY